MKKNRRLSRIIIFSGILLLIQACSFLNPSESDAKVALNELCQKQGGYCRIKSLQKTDGLGSEVSGVKYYKLSYQAEVECLGVKQGPESADYEYDRDYRIARCGNVGDVKKIHGAVNFKKSEKGWMTSMSDLETGPDRPQDTIEK
jgi:hypothetical protein